MEVRGVFSIYDNDSTPNYFSREISWNEFKFEAIHLLLLEFFFNERELRNWFEKNSDWITTKSFTDLDNLDNCTLLYVLLMVKKYHLGTNFKTRILFCSNLQLLRQLVRKVLIHLKLITQAQYVKSNSKYHDRELRQSCLGFGPVFMQRLSGYHIL